VDLILSDINMPSMDGLEFLRQIRAQNLAPGVPVVMITTESSEEHVKQAILAGARGYIRKPFTAEQVKERVLPLIMRRDREDDVLLNGVRKAAIATSAGGGKMEMERTMAVSLRESVHLVSDPRNLDASVEEVFQLMLGVDCQRDPWGPIRSSEPESVTAVVGFGGC
jgi:CheY-like chemotaxis protein